MLRIVLLLSLFIGQVWSKSELYKIRTDDVKAVLDTVHGHFSRDEMDLLSHESLNGFDDIMVHTTHEHARRLKQNLNHMENTNVEWKDKALHVLNEKIMISKCQTNASWTLTIGNSSDSAFFDCFWQQEEIFRYLDELVAAQPDYISTFEISKTFEGRSIPAFRVSTNHSVNKPIVYIQGMLHAREWISPPTVVYAMAKLLDDVYHKDVHVLELLRNVDFVFVPLINIDGYMHTWESNRYWRKNRRVTDGLMHGVDLNRNYGPERMFCQRGSSKSKDSDVYCGTAPYSEPEISGIETWMQATPNIKGSIDVHCYQSAYLVPKAGKHLQKMTMDIIEQVNTIHNDFRYSYRMTTTGGTFKDSQYHSYNNRPSYTLELRGNDFQVNPMHIRKSGEENYLGFLTFALKIQNF